MAFVALLALLGLALVRAQPYSRDWLVSFEGWPQPTFTQNADASWTLTNGLVSRTFIFTPAFGTVDFVSHATRQTLLRAIDCEAYVTLDSTQYALGGIWQTGTYYHAYLNRSELGIEVNPQGWNASSWSLSTPVAPFPWTPGTRGSPATSQWPPQGLTLTVTLVAPASAPARHKAVSVTLSYELYPGIPLLTQWVTATSTGAAAAGVVVSGAVPVTMRLAQPYSPRAPNAGTGDLEADITSWLYVQTDQAHGTEIDWTTDGAAPADPGADEACLISNYTSGPGVILSGGNASAATRGHSTMLYSTRVGSSVAEFVSFRTFLLVTDTYDPERTGLAVHRLYRLWAPHAQENPIFFHATDTTAAGFKLEIDQMAAVGFEMLIYSFGSGFNLETADPTYLAEVKTQIDYAHSQGIEVGGYDLICLQRGQGGYGGNVGLQWDTVEAGGGYGEDACFASGWVDKLNDFAYGFINKTGLSMLETDGPYGGESCASTNHSGHLQLSDSVYQQTQAQASWYAGLRSRNVYINQPDEFFFQGGQRTGLGYNEDQYSLPRQQDLMVSRMTVYDRTYRKLPTQGWMFLPLVDYHGGGADAAFEPMSQHLADYRTGLAQYLLAGVAACYRGFRLYDTPEVSALVAEYVAIYKKYRDIITSDIIHVRRPNGNTLDAFMHVNPALANRGFAAVFNPTLSALNETMSFNLYYTGITTTAVISMEGANPVRYALARDFSVLVDLAVPAQGVTWFVIESGDT